MGSLAEKKPWKQVREFTPTSWYFTHAGFVVSPNTCGQEQIASTGRDSDKVSVEEDKILGREGRSEETHGSDPLPTHLPGRGWDRSSFPHRCFDLVDTGEGKGESVRTSQQQQHRHSDIPVVREKGQDDAPFALLTLDRGVHVDAHRFVLVRHLFGFLASSSSSYSAAGLLFRKLASPLEIQNDIRISDDHDDVDEDFALSSSHPQAESAHTPKSKPAQKPAQTRAQARPPARPDAPHRP